MPTWSLLFIWTKLWPFRMYAINNITLDMRDPDYFSSLHKNMLRYSLEVPLWSTFNEYLNADMHMDRVMQFMDRVMQFMDRVMQFMDRVMQLSNFTTCPWTQVNSQNPLSQWELLAQNIDIFFLFLEENIRCVYSLEVPRWGTSNEYPQHMFSSKNKQNIYLKIWTLFLARVMKSLSQDK